jgi:hypothetical protein
MKTNRFGILPVTAAILTVAATGQLQAQLAISWNLDDYSQVNPTAGPNGNLAGVPGLSLEPDWNDSYNQGGVPYGPTTNPNLMDNTGTATTASVTVPAAYSSYAVRFSHPGADANGNYNNELLNGYQNANTASTISVAGIPYANYEMIVYFNADVSGRAGTVGIGSTTYDFLTMGTSAINIGGNAVFTQATDITGNNAIASDYAVFTGLSGASQNINWDIPQSGGINGFQIMAVPEPSSMALAVLGGFGVLLMKRRFKKC